MDYDIFRRAAADDLFASLSPGEQSAIEGLARSKAPPTGRATASLANIMFGIERARITIEHNPDKVPTFEQWKLRMRTPHISQGQAA